MHETTRLLRDLVALAGASTRMGRDLRGPEIFEHRVTAYLEDFFRGLGVRSERQAIAPGRDNILAWYGNLAEAPAAPSCWKCIRTRCRPTA